MSAPAIDDVFLQSLGIVEAHPDYRTLRRFVPREWYSHEDHKGALAFGLFCDVETTGLDTESDEIIEIGLVPFTFDRKQDVIVKVVEPIPGDWTMLTSSHAYKKSEAFAAEFNIPVPKDREVKLAYRVRMRY